jgi:hypothetical protein
LAVLAIAALAGCATLPRSIDIPREQIEAALARQFPYEARAADLFAFRLGVPQLELLPDANRLRLRMRIDAEFAGNALEGDAAASFGLRYEASDASLRMANVRVESFDARGLPAQWRRPFERAAANAAQQLLDDAPWHRFRPEQLERARGWTPGEIRVTPAGVRVELRPPAP